MPSVATNTTGFEGSVGQHQPDVEQQFAFVKQLVTLGNDQAEKKEPTVEIEDN